jgi:hypothetical protein
LIQTLHSMLLLACLTRRARPARVWLAACTVCANLIIAGNGAN